MISFVAVIIDSTTVGKISSAPGGGILVEGRIGRSGVQAYYRPDGSKVRAYRPREHVLAADFTGCPLTVGHPPGGVTPENYKSLSVGTSRGRTREEELDGQVYPVESLQVSDGEAIDRVKAGDLCELSCGYDVQRDWTAGVTDGGQEYDVIFTDYKPNHIAFGPKGFARAGKQARTCITDGNITEDNMADTLFASIQDSADKPPVTDGHDALVAENATLKAERAGLVNDAAASKAALTKAEASLAAAEKALADVPKLIADGIKTGSALRAVAAEYLPKDYIVDGKDPKDVKAAIVAAKRAKLKALDPDLAIADGVDEAYLDAYLTAADRYKTPVTHDYNQDSNLAPLDPVLDGTVSVQDHISAVSAKLFGGGKS